MGDFIARYGIFAGIGVPAILAVVALARRNLLRNRRAIPALPLPIRPLDVEVIPLWFEASLIQQPEVCVWVQVVNYTRKELRLTHISATYFHLETGGPAMENIPAVDYRIPPRQSSQIMLRRHLHDSEAKLLSAVPWADRFSAHLNIRVRGAVGKKEIELDPTFRIHGWVAGLPSHTAAKPAAP